MSVFNVNQYVWVQLTETGLRIHREHYEPYSGGKYQSPTEVEDGWYAFQMHELMRLFGDHMQLEFNSSELPFSPEILLKSPLG